MAKGLMINDQKFQKKNYDNMVRDLTGKNTSQWYSFLKRMTALDQQKKKQGDYTK